MVRQTPALLVSRPAAAEAYGRLCPVLDALGHHEVEEKKSSMHVVAGRGAFLGVHPRKDGLQLNLVLSRALTGERVVKTEKLSANRYHNEVDLEAGAEVDDELGAWLAEAYARVTG